MGQDLSNLGRRLNTWVLAALAPVLMFVGTSRGVINNYQTDFWHHLARGRAIVEQGRLVDEDIFTYTVAGESFRDPNWLTQVFYYRLYQGGGMPLLRLVNSLTLAAMMTVLVFHCRRASGSLLLAAALGMFAFFGLWQQLVLRPQTFSLLLFALLYLALDLSEQRRGWLLLAPFLLALWANSHGAFPIGIYLIGVFLLAAMWEAGAGEPLSEMFRRIIRDRRVRDLAICLGFGVLATGLNPYGYALIFYVDQTARSASARGIMEWVPPPLSLLIGKLWVASLLLTVIALALPGRPRARNVLLLLCFLPLPCGAARMTAWWLLTAMPVLATQFGGWLTRPVEPSARPSSLIGGVSLALLATAVVMSLPGPDRLVRNGAMASRREGVMEDDLEKIAASLRQAPGKPRRLFCPFEWGEYLGWALQPDGYRVFLDGRVEICPDPVWADYVAVGSGQADWQEILDRYQVDGLILSGDYEFYTGKLRPLVERSEKWRSVCKRGEAVLFLRVPEAPGNGAGAKPRLSSSWK